ncbi:MULTISPECIES: glycosyltransferase [unclassified Pseudomonas]|uniref:glycosyltransferase n=1 Tax=unclassified Pseudomonas TaxID=196821 RepID=UPI0013151C93|nr:MULTISPECIES: glycosyltransferase [unclassified Pseudomonas]MBM7399845.1 glycosyltransferase involved in cell wall biosynthesis [Pseudomonas sp. M5]HDS1758576.1 glycosyltransferase [Pseudomonas putida]
MNIWLIKLEEPVPQDADYRPYRMGMLERELVANGHSVVRWCSDLNHLTGLHRYGVTCSVKYSDRQQYEFINSGVKYKSAISVGRIIDNFLIKLKIRKRAKELRAPDLIVCSMPTPALCKLAAVLAREYGIPLVLDCRDYWPEVILAEAKGWKALAARLLAFKMRRDLIFACKQSHSFIGITDFFTRHLLKHAGRHPTRFDVVFPLGFDSTAIICSEQNRQAAFGFWAAHGIALGKGQRVVYFAGRLNRTVYDAIEPVVQAAQQLAEVNPDIVFVLCGSGSYQEAIKERFSCLSNVILPGEVDATFLKVLRDYSVAALQPIDRRIDYQNSYSNKFFEYLSSGLPIFSWLDGISGQKLVAEKCGYIYNSSAELIEKMSMFFDDDDLQVEMSSRAKKLFAREFEAKTVYSGYARHLDAVVEESLSRTSN